MEPDGLLMRDSGGRIKQKHNFLRRYCKMFTTSMKGKWTRVYVDLMAGPGLCRIERTGEVLPGSPLIALDHDFDQYWFYEWDRDAYSALEQRIHAHPKASQCHLERVQWQTVDFDRSLADPKTLVLVFMDPEGIREVPWSGVERLVGACNRVDIMMTIQHGMGIKLNVRQYLAKPGNTAIDSFLGPNKLRERLVPTSDFCEEVVKLYAEKMGTLGFLTRRWTTIRLDNGVPLYYQCLFSRSRLALHFWDKTLLKNADGQRAMDI